MKTLGICRKNTGGNINVKNEYCIRTDASLVLVQSRAKSYDWYGWDARRLISARFEMENRVLDWVRTWVEIKLSRVTWAFPRHLRAFTLSAKLMSFIPFIYRVLNIAKSSISFWIIFRQNPAWKYKVYGYSLIKYWYKYYFCTKNLIENLFHVLFSSITLIKLFHLRSNSNYKTNPLTKKKSPYDKRKYMTRKKKKSKKFSSHNVNLIINLKILSPAVRA